MHLLCYLPSYQFYLTCLRVASVIDCCMQTLSLHKPESMTVFVTTFCTSLCHLDLLSLCMQTPNFHKLSAISLLAAIMSIGYSTIAIGVAGHAGKQPGTEYNLDGYTRMKGLFGIFNSLGTIAFAYGGHNVVMEIQATIPSRPTATKPNPTCAPMMVSLSPYLWHHQFILEHSTCHVK